MKSMVHTNGFDEFSYEFDEFSNEGLVTLQSPQPQSLKILEER